MGCKLTKALTNGEGKSPTSLNAPNSPKNNKKKKKKDRDIEKNGKLEEPPPPPALDPRLPLTARQKFSIVKSWKGISRALEPTGVTMFVKLFERNAELLSLFDKFRELKTPDEQAESLELAEHATVVMSSIDEGIRAMDNVDFFFDLLYQIGGSHVRIPGFKKEYFWKIESPFLEAVRLTLGDRYTDNMDQIYKLTIKFVIETVVKGYEMAAEREVNENVQKLNSISERTIDYGSKDAPDAAAGCSGGETSAPTEGQNSAEGSAATCPMVCPYVPPEANSSEAKTS